MGRNPYAVHNVDAWHSMLTCSFFMSIMVFQSIVCIVANTLLQPKLSLHPITEEYQLSNDPHRIHV
jgi:hypothetical protein